MVAVTLNYRAGIPGFFNHPELSAESEHHASGNSISISGAAHGLRCPEPLIVLGLGGVAAGRVLPIPARTVERWADLAAPSPCDGLSRTGQPGASPTYFGGAVPNSR